MSDFGVCPLCGHNCFSDDCLHATADYIAEIEKLRAALEEIISYDNNELHAYDFFHDIIIIARTAWEGREG